MRAMNSDTARRSRGGSVLQRKDAAEVLRSAFPRSSTETQQMLLSAADIRTFRREKTVVDQGEESRIGLILAGHLGFRRTTVDGREVMPRIGSRGDMAPFMPIAGRPSTAEAVALTTSRVAFWPAADVLALAAGDAGFAIDILEHVMFVFEEVVDRMDGLLYQNALRRVARILDQHADIIFGEEAVVTRAYLPALVGTSREMTGRVLRRLESEGVVQRIGRDRLRLLDATGLARTAAAPTSARG
jgi:CRP-like cAMP-binding protein